MQIQSGRTVPLSGYQTFIFDSHRPFICSVLQYISTFVYLFAAFLSFLYHLYCMSLFYFILPLPISTLSLFISPPCFLFIAVCNILYTVQWTYVQNSFVTDKDLLQETGIKMSESLKQFGFVVEGLLMVKTFLFLCFITK